MILSVCIATHPARQAQFENLRRVLGEHPDVEFVIDPRPKEEENCIGRKRQAMIEQATADYIVHLDDDDHVPPDYLWTIVAALHSKPDFVGHYELVEGMGNRPMISRWTNVAPGWLEGHKAKAYGADFVRTPFHKTPIKRANVLAIGFNPMHFGEDHDFSKRLKASGLIRSEVFIPRVLYTYRFTPEDHKTKFGVQ